MVGEKHEHALELLKNFDEVGKGVSWV